MNDDGNALDVSLNVGSLLGAIAGGVVGYYTLEIELAGAAAVVGLVVGTMLWRLRPS